VFSSFLRPSPCLRMRLVLLVLLVGFWLLLLFVSSCFALIMVWGE